MLDRANKIDYQFTWTPAGINLIGDECIKLAQKLLEDGSVSIGEKLTADYKVIIQIHNGFCRKDDDKTYFEMYTPLSKEINNVCEYKQKRKKDVLWCEYNSCPIILAGYFYYISTKNEGLNEEEQKTYKEFIKPLYGAFQNFFKDIKSKDDIYSIVSENLAAETKGETYNEETALIKLLVEYLYTEAPKDEQNLFMLADLIARIDKDQGSDTERLFTMEKKKEKLAPYKEEWDRIKVSVKGNMNRLAKRALERMYPLDTFVSLLTHFKVRGESRVRELAEAFINNFESTKDKKYVQTENALMYMLLYYCFETSKKFINRKAVMDCVDYYKNHAIPDSLITVYEFFYREAKNIKTEQLVVSFCQRFFSFFTAFENAALDNANNDAEVLKTIANWFPTGDANKKLKMILTSLKNGLIISETRCNIIIYTKSQIEFYKFVEIVEKMFKLYGQIKSYELSNGINSSLNYSSEKITAIHRFEDIALQAEKDKNIDLRKLARKIVFYPKAMTIISGDKKEIARILGPDKDLYFNWEVDFEDWGTDKIAEIIVKSLKNAKIDDAFRAELVKYVNDTYPSHQFQNHDYCEWLTQQINTNYYSGSDKKTNYTPEMLPSASLKLKSNLSDLNHIVGVNEFKRHMQNLSALLSFYNKMGETIKKSDFNMHMIFMGNPGTGKTMCARLVAELLYEKGYIKQNKLLEVAGKDLIGEYVGQTSIKTFSVLQQALDGVLFIDEAYSTMGQAGTTVNYSQDFVSTLLKAMEDYKDRLVIIFAGYKDEMDGFMKSNPGLQSRIGFTTNFEDYTLDELLTILENKLMAAGLELDDGARKEALAVIDKASKVKNFGNGRFIMNFYQYIVIKHAENSLSISDKEQLKIIKVADITTEILDKIGYEKRLGFE